MKDISARELKGHNILAVERFWDTMRWQLRLPAYSCDFESTMITLTDWREYSLWKSSLHEKKLLKS